VTEGRPVLRIFHDHDGDWQFLCSAPEHLASEGRLICLGCAEKELGVKKPDIPIGMAATRMSVDDDWELSAVPSETDEDD
jgi:hypothetical protein